MSIKTTKTKPISERIRYRRIVTSIHDDEWFSRLKPGARNLYLNLIPVVGTSGAQNMSIEKMARISGYRNTIMPMWMAKTITKKNLLQLEGKVRYWDEDEVVWILNFTKVQGKGERFITGAVRHANNFPEHIRDVIVALLNPVDDRVSGDKNVGEHTLQGQIIGKSYGAYDTPLGKSDQETHGASDTGPDTHGRAGAQTGGQDRVTELQSNRDTEVSRKSVSPHVRARDFVLNYLDKCPSGIAINSEIKHDWMLTLIDKALDAEPPEWWERVFEKAEESDFLSGRVPSGKGEFFELKFGWLVQYDIAKRILAGDYDKFKSKKPDNNRISRDPTSEWNQREMKNA